MTRLMGIGLISLLLFVAPRLLADAPTFEQRFATFPKINAVRDVDWYNPLEIAKGKPGAALPVAAPGKESIARNRFRRR